MERFSKQHPIIIVLANVILIAIGALTFLSIATVLRLFWEAIKFGWSWGGVL